MRIIVLTLLLIGSSAFAKDKASYCATHLGDKARENTTENLFAYLEKLHKDNVISLESLVALKTELETTQSLTTPVTNKTSTDHEIHAEAIQAYFSSKDLDHDLLLKNLIQFLSEQSLIQKNKTESKTRTEDSSRKIKFHLIKKGSFTKQVPAKSQPGGPLVTVDARIALPHDFEMMDTKITQKMWFDVFGGAPVKPEEMDQPKVHVTIWSALYFANEMSHRAGLKPAYILDDAEYESQTSAKDGSLKPRISVLALPTVRFNSASGSVYDTEGYRLPTVDEQYFVRTNRGQTDQNHFFPGVNEKNILKYAWLKDNAKELMPVAELSPFVIDKNKFYDLYGNTWEFALFYEDEKLQTAYTGGSFSTLIGSVLHAVDGTPINGNHAMGFRLVRTIKPK